MSLKHFLSDFDRYLEMLAGRLPEQTRAHFLEQAGRLRTEAAAFLHALDQLAADPGLNRRGRSDRATASKARLAEAIDAFLGRTGEALDARVPSLSAALLGKARFVPPSDPGARIGFELRAREVRDALLKYDRPTRTALYMGLADPAARAAVEFSPPVLEPGGAGRLPRWTTLVDAKVVADAALERARAADPAAAAELDTVRANAEAFRAIAQYTRQGLVVPDPDLSDAAPAGAPPPAVRERLHDGAGRAIGAK